MLSTRYAHRRQMLRDRDRPADEHAATFLRDNNAEIDLCTSQRQRERNARESVRDFLWWVIEARCTPQLSTAMEALWAR